MNFRLLEGFSAETSGCLLIMIPASNADEYRKELKERFGQNSWIVGEVESGDRQVKMEKDIKVIQVLDSFLDF